MASSNRNLRPPPAEHSEIPHGDLSWLHSWIDTELLSFLQAHYDIPVEALHTLADDVYSLMHMFEDIENDENTVARIVHAAINRKAYLVPRCSLSEARLNSYIHVAAVLVDYRDRNVGASIAGLLELGKALNSTSAGEDEDVITI